MINEFMVFAFDIASTKPTENAIFEEAVFHYQRAIIVEYCSL